MLCDHRANGLGVGRPHGEANPIRHRPGAVETARQDEDADVTLGRPSGVRAECNEGVNATAHHQIERGAPNEGERGWRSPGYADSEAKRIERKEHDLTQGAFVVDDEDVESTVDHAVCRVARIEPQAKTGRDAAVGVPWAAQPRAVTRG